MDDTEANLTVRLRCCKPWENVSTGPLQALPGVVYPVLQVVGMVSHTVD